MAHRELPFDIFDRVIPEPNSGCWIWSGAVNDDGYATVGKKNIRVHRLSYQSAKGPIPNGLVIDHVCRVRCCVNPSHLEAVTIKENVLRGEGLTARYSKQTHCKWGHEYTRETVRLRKRNGMIIRVCKTCHSMERKRRNAAHKSLDQRHSIT